MARNLGNEPELGDNSAGMLDGAAARRFIDRAKALENDRDAIREDLKEVYAEAKEAGFVTARLRNRVKKERMDQGVLAAQEAYDAALDAALAAIGPLGQAAVAAKRERKTKAKSAIEAAQAHLDGIGEPADAETTIQ